MKNKKLSKVKIKEEIVRGGYGNLGGIKFTEDGNIDDGEIRLEAVHIEDIGNFELIKDGKSKVKRDGMRELARMKGYVVLKEEIAKAIKECPLGSRKVINRGCLGTGIYIIANKRYAMAIAKRRDEVIIEIEISLKGCMNLLKNDYIEELNEVYNTYKVKSDCELFDKISELNKGKISSIKSVTYCGNKLWDNSKVREYMSELICVKDEKVIKRWGDISKAKNKG